ncbi:MAG: hypothetical protein RLZZ626_963 [Actinomycetota bacterium]
MPRGKIEFMFAQRLPRAVLWDLDGTLIDSEHYWMNSERLLAAKYNAPWSAADGESLVGMSLYDSTKIMKEKFGSELEPHEIIELLTDSVTEQLRGAIPWRPGAQELLRLLRANGVKTALVTMSMRRMAEQVVAAIDFDAFDVIVAGDDVEHGKPHPEAYLLAAALLGEKPGDCIAIEDSLTGLTSAEAAGTRAIAVPNIQHIPSKPGRIIWETLEGASMRKLRKAFKTK